MLIKFCCVLTYLPYQLRYKNIIFMYLVSLHIAYNTEMLCWSYLLTYLIHGAESFLRSYLVSASPEIPPISWNPKVHYRVHKCPNCDFLCQHFVARDFLLPGVVSTLPKPQVGGPPLVSCTRLLIQYIRSYTPYLRPFLHLQPEDTPCRGDREPVMVWCWPLADIVYEKPYKENSGHPSFSCSCGWPHCVSSSWFTTIIFIDL